jgi:hypothetical protein
MRTFLSAFMIPSRFLAGAKEGSSLYPSWPHQYCPRSWPAALSRGRGIGSAGVPALIQLQEEGGIEGVGPMLDAEPAPGLSEWRLQVGNESTLGVGEGKGVEQEAFAERWRHQGEIAPVSLGGE